MEVPPAPQVLVMVTAKCFIFQPPSNLIAVVCKSKNNGIANHKASYIRSIYDKVIEKNIKDGLLILNNNSKIIGG